MEAANVESGCDGGGCGDCSCVLATSAAVSVAAQKAGGELIQPMGSTRGSATNGSFAKLLGKTTPRCGTSLGATSMR